MRLPDLANLTRVIRTLRRSPGFVAVSVLSLGVALGLSTATFAMVDGALHPRVLFQDGNRVYTTWLRWGNQHTGPTVAEQARTLRSMPAVQAVGVESWERQLVTLDGLAKQRLVVHVTPDLFQTLRVRLKLGRYPTRAEAAGERAVLVSEDLWAELFADRPGIDGASLSFQGHIYSVVGVVPRGDAGPLSGDIVIPFASAGAVQRLKRGTIIVRLRAGLDSAAVNAQLATIAARFTAQYVSPASASPPYRLQLVSMLPQPVRLSENLVDLLLVALAFGILLIGCTNVTALALARGLTRKRDHALRIALGAPRVLIGADVLGEVGVLGVMGAALGLLVAFAVVGMLRHIVPSDLSTAGFYQVRFSGRVFAAAGLALVGGMLIAGGVPAWRASRLDPADPLKDYAGTTTGRTRNEFRFLVISELTVAMVLLMLTSLVALSTRNLADYAYGFDAKSLLNIGWGAATSSADTAKTAELDLQTRLLETVRTTPWVVEATTMGYAIPEGGEIFADVRPTIPSLDVQYTVVAGPSFFRTMGIPLLSGRDISASDILGNGAAVLSRTAAKELFPHDRPLGHMIRLGRARSQRPWVRVVGVVPDLSLGPTDSYDPTVNPLVFVSPSRDDATLRIVARTTHVGPARLVALRRTLEEVLPPTRGVAVQPWTYYQTQQVHANRFFEELLSMLSFAALILGVTGLFSVLSYSVGQRMREFAVRQALGATPLNIVRVVLIGAFEMALGGTAIGALLSFWASAAISWMLFGVKNTDPMSLVIAETTLIAVALTAALVPAIRAMRADPVEILRST